MIIGKRGVIGAFLLGNVEKQFLRDEPEIPMEEMRRKV